MQTKRARSLVRCGAVLALVLGTSYLACKGRGWLGGEGKAQRQADELDLQLLGWKQRGEARDEVVRDLQARRITLLEAAARFRQLDHTKPDFNWEAFRQCHPGRCDDERHCRHVIAWAKSALSTRPSEAAELVARLEAELQEHLRRDGAVRLPE
jgi:hypothetical protein